MLFYLGLRPKQSYAAGFTATPFSTLGCALSIRAASRREAIPQALRLRSGQASIQVAFDFRFAALAV
ncbi:MAG: hypothetical protein V7L29_11950 [Nostoc sp.]|uniref:hypothetical protein n=1 Tax=Nostoc sp. TaxID=1180 RepID=UPI002FFBFDA7